jgi:Tfp pilus assembly protein PilV
MKRSDQAGFSIVETLLILVIISILGFTGWYVYHAKQTSNKNYSTNNSTVPTYKKKTTAKAAATTDPYAGWRTATLKYEQVSYRYPADWTVTDTSASTPKDDSNGCVYPGTDSVVLTSPSNHQISLRTGVDCLGGSGAKTFDSIPVISLGQNLYITLAAASLDSTPADPTSACLSPTATQAGYPTGIKSKNIFFDGGFDVPGDDFCYWPYLFNSSGATPPQLTASQMKNSADFATAKLVFESMKYTAN